MSVEGVPQPRRNSDNAPFIDAWKRGKLAFQRCGCCRKAIFYPRPMCPDCWGEELHWEESSGAGTIVSFTIVHKAGNAALQEQVPIVVAEVELQDGFSMIARVATENVSTIASGQPVRLVSVENAALYPLPTFCKGA